MQIVETKCCRRVQLVFHCDAIMLTLRKHCVFMQLLLGAWRKATKEDENGTVFQAWFMNKLKSLRPLPEIWGL